MEKRDNPFQQGQVLLIDKPYEWTSFGVVKKIKYQIKKCSGHKVKVGHAGTLDPLATGLLICCTGKFTKNIVTYQRQEKEYTGTFHLGAVTPTYDLESDPEDFQPIEHLKNADLEKTVSQFIGQIKQIPPAHSAIKKDGKRAYELARKGLEVDLKSREIEIKIFELTRIQLPEVDFRVVCSTGTYIRSLANDFGNALGCGAYLSRLRRTRIGEFEVDKAGDVPATMDLIEKMLSSQKED